MAWAGPFAVITKKTGAKLTQQALKAVHGWTGQSSSAFLKWAVIREHLDCDPNFAMDMRTLSFLRQRAAILECTDTGLMGINRAVLRDNPRNWIPRLRCLLGRTGWTFDATTHTFFRLDTDHLPRKLLLCYDGTTVDRNWLSGHYLAKKFKDEARVFGNTSRDDVDTILLALVKRSFCQEISDKI